ncbi:MAG TPA: phage holin family protein [Candidatus Limnocylindrales bacterium]
MIGRAIVALVVNAVALFVTIQVVPGLEWPNKLNTPNDILTLLIVAVIFAAINTFLKPIAKLLSLPVNLITVGLFGFIVNAVLFVLAAVIAGAIGIKFTVGDFPPTFTAQTIVSAVVGSIVLSIVGRLLSLVVDRD